MTFTPTAIRPRTATLGLALVALLSAAAPARAQGPAYHADTPHKQALYRDGSSERYLLAGAWLSRADLADQGIAQGLWKSAAATQGWSPVTVPNAYNAGDFSSASMIGSVNWYRKDFRLPAHLPRDTSWIARFESVSYGAQVWLNGHPLGSHVGGYLPFELDLRGLHAGVNRLVVRVDDRRSAADLPPGGFYADGVTPVGGWWNYGGILREVYLRAVRRADLAQVQVRPLMSCPTCAATIDEQVLLRNVTGVAQPVHLRGTYGGASLDFGTMTLAPHATATAHAQVGVRHPRLWSPEHPALYRATLTLSGSRGTPLGGYVTYSGIRSIKVTRGGRLELNGRRVNLRGFGLHESDVKQGAALDPAHLSRLVGWARQLGAKLLRSHYPLNPQIEEMADRDGIMIWSEVPVYQVQSQYLTNPGWLAGARARLQANVLTNQNHPSVLLWSIGNELASPPEGPESAYIAGATALVHQLDPTRPVGMAISSWPGIGCQAAYAPLDVIGFNDYFGWYDAGGGGTADREGLGPYLDEFRACYRHKGLFVSEFGFEANRDGPSEERGTYGFQSDALLYHLSVYNHRPWLAGAIYWALQDFVCRPAWSGGNPYPDPPFFHKGLIDLLGNRKPAFSVAAAAFRTTGQIGPAADRAQPRVKRQRSRVATTRKPSRAVSFLPSSVVRAR